MIVISGILFTWSLARVVCMALPRGGGWHLVEIIPGCMCQKLKKMGPFLPPDVLHILI